MHDLPIILTITVAFGTAWVLGIITHKLGLSPIVGYLLAGVLIGPHTPGFVGDVGSAGQLAEIGVILLMFGVGLHFHLKDLLAVRAIAVPGAIGQSVIATAAGAGVFALFGWPLSAGLVVGVAMAVASTVVLMRVLMDTEQLDTPQGHAAVGWLIVEDIITVIVLVLIPALAGTGAGAVAEHERPAAVGMAGEVARDVAENITRASSGGVMALALALGKLAVLVTIVLVAGSRVVPWILVKAAKLRSRELFTLTVLVISVSIATGSAVFFGASMALGAFLAGMVVGQSPVSQQAGADILPLRDAFAVLFFVSVGMLFDPRFLLEHPLMVVAGLVIVLVVKPLAALLIVAVLGYPAKTALTVAVGLAQIGEFSFILSELARKAGVLPVEGHNVLVAVALLSISVNPILFRSLGQFEGALRRRAWVWRLVNGRSERRALFANAAAKPSGPAEGPLALIVGYGPAGLHLDRLLREAGIATLIIERNMDTVTMLRAQGREAVFGDASQASILEQAGVARAAHLILTMPDAAARGEIIAAARDLNPALKIFARARYAVDQARLQQLGGVVAAVDEIESAVALSRLVLLETGAGPAEIKAQMQRIRREFEAPKAGA